MYYIFFKNHLATQEAAAAWKAAALRRGVVGVGRNTPLLAAAGLPRDTLLATHLVAYVQTVDDDGAAVTAWLEVLIVPIATELDWLAPLRDLLRKVALFH